MAQEMATARRQDVARPEQGRAVQPGVIYRPDTDIYEDDEHVFVIADMPGVAPDDVDITLERRVLTIHGRVNTQRPEGYRPVYMEYGEGDYERVFALSEEIDRDRIEARHEMGVLYLKLPKAETARTRRIEVKAA